MPTCFQTLSTLTLYRYTVIDEADEMLNDDWQEELGTIMAGGGPFRQN